MLVRRSVEHHVGTMLLEDSQHSGPVADVAEDRFELHARARPLGERLVQVGLVVIEHEQHRGTQFDDLTNQLRTDRSSGAGDENPLPGECLTHLFEIGLDGRSLEEVFGLKVTNVLHTRVILHDGVDVGKNPQPDVDRQAQVDEPSHEVRSVARRNDHLVDVQLLDEVGDFLHRTNDRKPGETPIRFEGFRGDEADHDARGVVERRRGGPGWPPGGPPRRRELAFDVRFPHCCD